MVGPHYLHISFTVIYRNIIISEGKGAQTSGRKGVGTTPGGCDWEQSWHIRETRLLGVH